MGGPMSETTFEIGEEVYTFPHQLAEVSEESLTDDMRKHPAHVAWFGVLYGILRAQREELEAAVKMKEAEVNVEQRSTFDSMGKKYTEALLGVLSKSDPRVKNLKIQLHQVRMNELKAHSVITALEHKRDMLVSVGAQERAEQETDIRTMKKLSGTFNQNDQQKGDD